METSHPENNVTPLRGKESDTSGIRTPPHNFEAEMALLGAILANNRVHERVSEFLRAEHFADDRHGRADLLVQVGAVEGEEERRRAHDEEHGQVEDAGLTRHHDATVAEELKREGKGSITNE